VPPAPERLPQALNNWEKYVHFDEKDGLVQLAVVKAQFEIIHPFLDGNGRVGRMLVPLFLFTKKLLSSPMFYLSAYFDANREAYITRLQAISQEHDWNGWIQFFLAAVVKQAAINTDRAARTGEICNKGGSQRDSGRAWYLSFPCGWETFRHHLGAAPCRPLPSYRGHSAF
jgi:Fic family protein